jgi:pseudouridine-5'-phosphate glycosidase
MLSQVSKRIRTHRVIKYRSVFTDVHISNEVREALSKNIPVVALESTIISHGMPFPMNLEVAKSLEESIRKEGAIPATIAIINGFPKVGLVSSDFNLLANPDSRSSVILKASRRDIAYACANRLNAGNF